MRLLDGLILYIVLIPKATAQNYYQLLGVKHTASAAEIKRSFRALAKQYHPDKSGNTQDAEKFMQIRKAYEVLGNTEKRQRYDAKLKFQSATFDFGSGFFQKKSRQAQEPNEEQPFFGTDFPFTDLFNMFFDAVKHRQTDTDRKDKHSFDKTGQQNQDSALTRFIVRNVLKALNLETSKSEGKGSTRSLTDRVIGMLGSCAGSGTQVFSWRCFKGVLNLAYSS